MGMFGFRSQTRCLLHLGPQALLQREYQPLVLAEPWPGALCGWRETRSHMHSIAAHATDAVGSLAAGRSPGHGWHAPSKPLWWGAYRYPQPGAKWG